MEIRLAQASDIGAISNLLLQVLEVHRKGRPDLFKASEGKYTHDELAEIIKDCQRPIFVCVDNGAVVGYVFCVIKQTLNDNILTDTKTLYIDDLCVDEKMRGKHIGKALYDYTVAYAKAQGCYNITLNVWSCNENAVKFYESRGLKPQKTVMEQIL